jgi:DNA-binding PadR family transcriptional regulator
MARARRGDLSAKAAVMGLLVQRSDTINGVRSRLEEKFAGAGWSSTVAYGAVDSLAEEGYVRVAAGGAERSLHVYEATAEGVSWFRRWLSDFSAGPPVLRDVLRAKLEYVADESDLLVVVAAIREQEEACFGESEAAHLRLNRARRRGELGSAKDPGWEIRLRFALMSDEVLWWRDWGKRLKRLRENLEDPGERLEGPGEGDEDDR